MVSLDEGTEGRGEGGRQWLGRFISPTEDLATERGRWEDRGNAMPFRSMSGRQPYRKQSSKCVQDVGRVCRISIPIQPLSKRIRNCVVAQRKLFHALMTAPPFESQIVPKRKRSPKKKRKPQRAVTRRRRRFRGNRQSTYRQLCMHATSGCRQDRLNAWHKHSSEYIHCVQRHHKLPLERKMVKLDTKRISDAVHCTTDHPKWTQ